MSEALAESVIQRHRRRKRKVKRITIDLDPNRGCDTRQPTAEFFQPALRQLVLSAGGRLSEL